MFVNVEKLREVYYHGIFLREKFIELIKNYLMINTQFKLLEDTEKSVISFLKLKRFCGKEKLYKNFVNCDISF